MIHDDIVPGIEVLDAIGICTAILIIILSIHLLLRPLRKRKFQKIKLTQTGLTLITILIWYFYPMVSFKGSYQPAEPPRMREDFCSGISIADEDIEINGVKSKGYQIDYLRRVLWIDMSKLNPDPEEPFFAVKVRWNRISVRFFSHWVKLKKT